MVWTNAERARTEHNGMDSRIDGHVDASDSIEGVSLKATLDSTVPRDRDTSC